MGGGGLATWSTGSFPGGTLGEVGRPAATEIYIYIFGGGVSFVVRLTQNTSYLIKFQS